MPPLITRDEYLVVNSVPLATPAWEATDLSDIYNAAGVRGEDRVIPFADGQKPLPRVLDVLRCLIPIDVFGEFDMDGDAYSDPQMGLVANLDVLRDEIFTPPGGDGTVPVVWHLRDGSERTAAGIVIPPFDPELLDIVTMAITLDLIIPAGRFEAGS